MTPEEAAMMQGQPVTPDTQPDAPQTAHGVDTGMRREQPKPEPAREALVSTWTKRIESAKAHWADTFKRMRGDMKFARGLQWVDQTSTDDERYVANLVLRHLSQKTAALYAKNPKAYAERRKRLDYQLWTGDPQELMQAQEIMQQVQLARDPRLMMHPQVQQAQQLLQDVEQGNRYRDMLDRVGQTLEIVYTHQLSQQIPSFKAQMKQLVRRAQTTGVGYVKLGFHRVHEVKPEHVDRVSDVTEQLAAIEQITADMADDQVQPYQAQAEELREMLQSLQQEQDVFVREGLDVDFPASTSLIIDTNCKQLNGFLGARWVAQEFLLTVDQVKRIYEVDLRQGGFQAYDHGKEGEEAKPTRHTANEPSSEGEDTSEDELACVWELYDRTTGLVYCIADGYKDFLKEPEAPYIKLERFFPFFVLTLNTLEDEESIFPPSDVTLLRDMQEEHNVARQRLREHRDANRPGYVAPKGRLSETDKTNLAAGPAHSVVELDGMMPNENIGNIIQAKPVAPIDPNLYETGSFTEDMMRTGGTQEANMGATSGATATETSVAESSRMTAISSNVDDLDEFLTEIAHSASHILLTEMSADNVRQIAGPGAVWPELSANEIAQDLWLTVRAGSSGKPNKAQEIQNFERLAPILLQIPGVSPKWMAEQAIERLDDRIDLKDAFREGMPSVAAQNQNAEPDQGEPGNGPNDQGGAGRDNARRQPQDDSNQGPNNAAVGPPNDGDRPTSVPRRGPGPVDPHRQPG